MREPTGNKFLKLSAWLQTLLILCLVWPTASGEWRCPDGSLCHTCAHTSCLQPCDHSCPDEQDVHAQDCHACCHYAAADAPILRHAPTQPLLEWQAVPVAPTPPVAELPPVVEQIALPAFVNSVRGSPPLGPAAPRAPPSRTQS